MPRSRATVSKTGSVQIDRGGQTHHGIYSVSADTLTVSSDTGSKRAELRGTSVSVLARILLGELVRDEEMRLARARTAPRT